MWKMDFMELEETSDGWGQNTLKNDKCINERYVWLSSLQEIL